MSELSTMNLLIEAHTCCTKRLSKICVEQHLEALVYVVKRLAFNKFVHVILMHWHVILCKMIGELLTSNMQKSMDNMQVWYT